MKTHALRRLVLLCAASTLAHAEPVPVRITPEGMTRGGKPYFIKGAGGDKRLDEMQRCGANSLRTWGDGALATLLPDAEKRGLTVCAGIWLEPECSWFSYHKPEHCERQFRRVREVVLKHKDAPALLCWGLGNEAEGDGKNAAFWKQIDRLAEMVHREDPAHPAFTALAGMTAEKAAGLNEHAPHLDFVGINIYGGIFGLREQLSKLAWKRPWVVTEYGPQGFWERPKSPWGAPLEQTSTEKALAIRDGYRRAIAPAGDCLGGYAFSWGQKQEATSTWFGLFTKEGERIATVDELEEIWNGKAPANRAPAMKPLTTEAAKTAVGPGEIFRAKIEATDPEGDTLSYRWEVAPEHGKRDKEGRELPIDPLAGCTENATKAEVEITAPKQPGQYRLFVFVLDGKGHAGTANVPFQVK
jgi:hypothetical protein